MRLTICTIQFRLLRLTYPWLPLAISLCRISKANGLKRHQEKVRFWLLVGRVDFANLLAIAIDLIQPEYWA